MGFEEEIKEWVFTIALKKGFKRIAYIVLAWGIVVKSIAFMASFGIVISADANALSALFYGLFEILRNYLKIKFPKKFSWL